MAFDVGAVVARLELDTRAAETKAQEYVTRANTQMRSLGSGAGGTAAGISKVGQELKRAEYQAGAFAGNLGRVVALTAEATPATGAFASSLGRVVTMAIAAGPELAIIAGVLVGITAGFMGAAAAGKQFYSLLNRGIGQIDKLRMTAAQMAASIQNAYPQAPFELALGAANKLIPLVERMDVLYSGTGADLIELANAMLRYGAAADVMRLIAEDSEKQRGAFVAVAEAIKAQTGGLNVSYQLNQEIRALMSGQANQGAALLRILQAQYPEIAKMIPLWSKQGTLAEHLAEQLGGYQKAAATVSGTLEAMRATWETITNRVLRAAFLPTYEDIVSLQKQLNALIQDQNGNLTATGNLIVNTLQGGWIALKGMAQSVLDILKMFAPNTQNWQDAVVAAEKALLGVLNTVLEINAKIAQAIRLAIDARPAAVAGGRKFYEDLKADWNAITTASQRYRDMQQSIGMLGYSWGPPSPPGMDVSGLGQQRPAPPEKEKKKNASAIAKDELTAAKELLQAQIEMAKTDRERLSLESQLADLLHRFSRDARLSNAERARNYTEEVKLRRQMAQESFQFQERDLDFQQKAALNVADLTTTIQQRIALYAQEASSDKLTQVERQEALGKQIEATRELQKVYAEGRGAEIALETARARAYGEQRTVILDSITEEQRRRHDLYLTDAEDAEIQQRILGLRRDLLDLEDEARRAAEDYAAQTASTFSQQLAALDLRLENQRRIVEQARVEGRSWQEVAGALGTILGLTRERLALMDEEFRLAAGYFDLTSLGIQNAEKQLALRDAEIAKQRQIIAEYQQGLRTEQELWAAVTETARLEAEKAGIQIDVLRERARLDELHGASTRAILQYELKALADLRAQYLALGQDGQAAVNTIDTEIRNVTEALQAQAFSFRNVMVNAAGGLESAFSGFFDSLMQGAINFGDLFRNILGAIRAEIAKLAAHQVIQGLLGKLFPVGGGDVAKAAEKQIQAGKSMWGAAVIQERAAKDMLNAAREMAASAGSGFMQPSGGGGFLGTLAQVAMIAMPFMASGGVVTRPTVAVVGERGPEAIVPLGREGLGPTVGEVHVHLALSVDSIDAYQIERLGHRIAPAVGAALNRALRAVPVGAA